MRREQARALARVALVASASGLPIGWLGACAAGAQAEPVGASGGAGAANGGGGPGGEAAGAGDAGPALVDPPDVIVTDAPLDSDTTWMQTCFAWCRSQYPGGWEKAIHPGSSICTPDAGCFATLEPPCTSCATSACQNADATPDAECLSCVASKITGLGFYVCMLGDCAEDPVCVDFFNDCFISC